MALPQLTDEQRKQALEKAAAARHARAELREQIKKGEKSLESVLNSDDPIASRMKVSTLIESLPGYGKAKAAKIPPKIRVFSFIMLLCFMMTYIVIIVYQIVNSLGSLF